MVVIVEVELEKLKKKYDEEYNILFETYIFSSNPDKLEADSEFDVELKKLNRWFKNEMQLIKERYSPQK